jgi:hypothetical protein
LKWGAVVFWAWEFVAVRRRTSNGNNQCRSFGCVVLKVRELLRSE